MDEDFEMDTGEDFQDEEYDFNYDDDEDLIEDDQIDLENKYYNAKAIKEEDPEGAIKEFESIVDQEEEKGEIGFKSLKQLIKLSLVLNKKDKALVYYEQLLSYTKSAVTKNYSERSINTILDNISTRFSNVNDAEFTENFYKLTLKSLKTDKNDRLWIKTNLKLAQLWLSKKDFPRLEKTINSIKSFFNSNEFYSANPYKASEAFPSSLSTNQSNGTYLLELYAIEIQMYTILKANKKIQAAYDKAVRIQSAIPHPKIMGIIRECGGKMYMATKQWEKAKEEFFESFKNYDEAGSPRRCTVLKYLVLSSMLSPQSRNISVFESPEARPYKSDPEIVAMTSLVESYFNSDIKSFERILAQNYASIMTDPFIKSYIDEVLISIRTSVICKVIQPFTRVSTTWIANKVFGKSLCNTTQLESEENVLPESKIAEVEVLIETLILDRKIRALLDRVSHTLSIDAENPVDPSYKSIYTKEDTKEESIEDSAFDSPTEPIKPKETDLTISRKLQSERYLTIGRLNDSLTSLLHSLSFTG